MPDIKEIAVIGAGGIAGLSTLYELLHVDKDGNSTVGEGHAKDSPFTKIVGFEQKANVGGVWNFDGYKIDPNNALPPQHILEGGRYNDIRELKPQHKYSPTSAELEASSLDEPITTAKDDSYLEWKQSAVYPKLYTNTPDFSLRHSTLKIVDDRNKLLDPFITHQNLAKRIERFSNDNKLQQFIRFNTEVVKAEKVGNKWHLVLKLDKDGKDVWYQEKFDGIIVANGFFTVPFVPYIKGLDKFNEKYPGDIIHSKAFRGPEPFRGKRVVIAGSNISAIDICQYIAPVAKEVIISRDISKEPLAQYFNRSIKSFPQVSKIKEIDPETRDIHLRDGQILKDVDKIILATGYHHKAAFLSDDAIQFTIAEGESVPSSSSKLKGTFLHTFKIGDPSLAFVGRLIVQAAFRNAEAESAAIAGVWSGYAKLPSEEKQREIEEYRIPVHTGSDIPKEHIDIYRIKERFYDIIKEYYPKGRADPIGSDLDSFKEFEDSIDAFERLFKAFMTGEIDVNQEF